MTIDEFESDEIEFLKNYFIENRVIKLSDILGPIEDYFFKLDFNHETQSFELYMGVPPDWLHDMVIEDYKIELIAETESGKIIKLIREEEPAILDDLAAFAHYVIQRNLAILAKINERKKELQILKDKMIEVQMELSEDIEKLKNITNSNDVKTDEESEPDIEIEIQKSQPVIKTTGKVYVPPKAQKTIPVVEKKINDSTLEDMLHGK